MVRRLAIARNNEAGGVLQDCSLFPIGRKRGTGGVAQLFCAGFCRFQPQQGDKGGLASSFVLAQGLADLAGIAFNIQDVVSDLKSKP